MAYQNTEMKALDTLTEALVDKHGINHVIESLMRICDAKAEHVAVNWQEANLGKRWFKVAIELDKASNAALEIP